MTTERDDLNIKDYSIVEFVAIPPDFDIMNYIGIRESFGVFKQENADLQHLKIISDGVRCSSVFSLHNHSKVSMVTCLFFIKILDDLGVTLKSVYNPIREQIEDYVKWFDERKDHQIYIKGQFTQNVNFTIINIFNLVNDGTINEVMQIAQNLQEYQQEFDKKLKTMKI